MQFESMMNEFFIRLKLVQVRSKFVEIRSRLSFIQLVVCSCYFRTESVFDSWIDWSQCKLVRYSCVIRSLSIHD